MKLYEYIGLCGPRLWKTDVLFIFAEWISWKQQCALNFLWLERLTSLVSLKAKFIISCY